MSRPGQEIILLHSQTISANGTSSLIVVPVDYNACLIQMSTGVPTGTSPTLQFFIQQGFRAVVAADNLDGLPLQGAGTLATLFDDYATFPQVTGTAATQAAFIRIVAGSGAVTNTDTRDASVTAASSSALGASIVRPGPLGMWWRIAWTVGGTSPAFPTCSITAQFMMSQT